MIIINLNWSIVTLVLHSPLIVQILIKKFKQFFFKNSPDLIRLHIREAQILLSTK